MIGMVGAPQLDESKVIWLGNRIRHIYNSSIYTMDDWALGEVKEKNL